MRRRLKKDQFFIFLCCRRLCWHGSTQAKQRGVCVCGPRNTQTGMTQKSGDQLRGKVLKKSWAERQWTDQTTESGLVCPLCALLTSATLGSHGTGDRGPATLCCPRPVTLISDVYTINKRSHLTIINTCKRTNMRTLILTNLEQYPRIYAAITGEIPNQIPTGDS